MSGTPGLAAKATSTAISDSQTESAAVYLPRNLELGLRQSQLPGLDGIRAIAALTVVLYHFGVPLVSGGLGVLIFFVLSGFLITWLLLKENERFGTVSLKNFYFRRALRIFPAFYSYWGIYISILVLRHKSVLWTQATASAFYVNNYFQAFRGDPNTGLSHTWSLGIEEQFYLLWPLGLLLLRKNKRRLAWILVAAICVLWLYREVLVVVGVPQRYIYEAFDTRADHLLIGCLLAVALKFNFASKCWRVLCSNSLGSLPFVCVLSVSSAMTFFVRWYRDAVGFVVEPVLVALLIAQVIAFRQSMLWSWLNLGWMRYLGRISYSIYLYQQIVIGPVKKTLAGFSVWVTLLATIAVVIVIASLSYHFVERPFLKLKDHFHKRRSRIETRAREYAESQPPAQQTSA